MKEVHKTVFDNWDLLDRLAAKRFRDPPLALEATNYVLKELARDNWARIHAFAGKCPARVYLAVVMRRLFEDFARQRFGREDRVPAWVSRLGMLWVKSYWLLCREGQSPAAALEILKADVPGGRDEDLIRNVIAVIRRKIPSCGSASTPSEVTGLDLSSIRAGPPDRQATAQTELVDLVYRALVDAPANSEGSVVSRFACRVREVCAELHLDPEERLLLRLVYEEGMRVSEAGRMLGLGVNAVHGRLRRLLARIRQTFDRSDIGLHLREASSEISEDKAWEILDDNP